MAEARKKVSKIDMEAYERKAAKYVKECDFSKRVNEDMRLYNLTMKVNRLEMFKAQIGLDMVSGFDDMDKYMKNVLESETYQEYERLAGILGLTVNLSDADAKSVVESSFHNANFSD